MIKHGKGTILGSVLNNGLHIQVTKDYMRGGSTIHGTVVASDTDAWYVGRRSAGWNAQVFTKIIKKPRLGLPNSLIKSLVR